ncbi:MAG: ABC transporter ATP-binding protein/permease [bacterium]|nr:ABC transporter ATP-binding protein/permease [bacterium]
MQLPLSNLREFLSSMSPYKRFYIAGFTGSLIEIITNLFGPWSAKLIIDNILSAGSHKDLLIPFLVRVSLFLLALGLIRAFAIYVQIMYVEKASQLIAKDLRNRLYRHILKLPFSFHNTTMTGDLMSRATSDVNSIREALGFGVLNAFYCITYYLGIMSVLFYLNWKFTLVASATLPILMYVGVRFRSKINPLYEKIQEEIARFTTIVQENISGIRVVKAFFKERMEIARFTRQNQVLLDTNMAIAKLQAFYYPFMDFLEAMTVGLVLFYGGRSVIQDKATIGLLVAFSGYLSMLIWPVRLVGFTLSLFQRGDASAGRILKLLSERYLPDLGRIEIKPEEVKGEVVFEHVYFKYPDSEDLVLEDINLIAKPGELIALVGTTGSGKSTLVQLIPRFFDVTAGSIRIDGLDIRDIPLSTLRRIVAVVFQETFLFSASIRDNIAFGKPEASFEEIVECAKLAQADEFIRELPNGYDTIVGERGLGLSGGQKQRIAIARALLMNPKVLILDDSTSSVDQETEIKIHKALENLMRGRTTFVIAQRLSTVKRADQIIVIDRGRIVERGTHSELISKDGYYRRIYDIQWGQTELLLRELREEGSRV